MSRPLLYDLFSSAGGSSRGYQLAGFRVIGIDHKPQPRFGGDEFIQADVFEFMDHYFRGDVEPAAAFGSSPPCQGYSRMRHLPWLKDREYPMLIDDTRALLEATGVPWVIENVEDAPLRNGVTLCGTMFGLKVYRHRKFESNVLLLAPPHQKHRVVIGSGRMLNDRAKPNPDGFVSLAGKGTLNRSYSSSADGMVTVAGHQFSTASGAAAMGIDWMTRDELSQAIPPAYCTFVGAQLLTALTNERAA